MFRPCLIVACTATLAFAAVAQETGRDDKPVAVERSFGDDRFSAGASLRVDKPVTGDLFAAGGSVDVDAPVTGDAIVGGGNVRISAALGDSLYAAGGHLRIDAPIARSARIAGGQIELEPDAKVGGNLTVAGGQIELRGAIKGHVMVGGGQVLIDGPIDGDVLATAGEIELGPNARIGGKLRYASRGELERDPAAQVAGSVERMDLEGEWSAPSRAERSLGSRGGWVWTLGLMVLAALLVGGLPDFYSRVAAALRARPMISLLIGLVALVCIPVAALILIVTIVGIPLALIAIGLYLALLLVGYASTGVAFGDWALQKFKADAAANLWWRVAAAMLAMLAIALAARVPYVGGAVVFAALIIGIGALLLQVRRPATT